MRREYEMKKKYIALLIILSMILYRGGNVVAKEVLKKPLGFLANGVEDNVVLSWEPVEKAEGYEIFEKRANENIFLKIKTTKACKIVLKNKKRGCVYQYKVRAYKKKDKIKTIYSKYGTIAETMVPKASTSTIKNFLTTALAPVGSTMYIWGGGWNKSDTGAGTDGLRIGLNPNWRKFCSKQRSSYNYKKHKYAFGNGLDCSGFVGWSIYNINKIKKGTTGDGYVIKAAQVASTYAAYGWGSYKKAKRITDWKPGDIMSSATHVYIVIGSCRDGSVVLLHSSPAGVRLSGTPDKKGRTKSEAVTLARKYMKKYPLWYKRYPSCEKGRNYLTDYNQFRWNTGKGKMISDPDNYQKKNAKQILENLYEKK